MSDMSAEQMVRDLLEKAVKDRIVRLPKRGEWGGSASPQARSAGELVGVANMLAGFLNRSKQDRQVE